MKNASAEAYGCAAIHAAAAGGACAPQSAQHESLDVLASSAQFSPAVHLQPVILYAYRLTGRHF